MPSNFTENYNLSQWSASDKVRHDDFNADNAAIDAALAAKAEQSALEALQTTVNSKASQSELDALKTTVSKKAEQSALETLKTTVTGKGNCQIVSGSYTGNGKYGSSTPNSLSFSKKPVLVLICGPRIGIMVRDHSTGYTLTYGTSISFTVSWTSTGVSWYNSYSDDGARRQLNVDGSTYHYYAFLEA